MKSRRAANDRRIIREPAVAVQLYELIEQALNEIKRVRAIRMTGQLHARERTRRFSHLGRFFFVRFFLFGFSHAFCLKSFSLSLWERVGERACTRQASHPPLTPPKGRGTNQASRPPLTPPKGSGQTTHVSNNLFRSLLCLSRRYDKLKLIGHQTQFH